VDVNAWRHIFLINEFNELQLYRTINAEITLIAYAVIMEGFGLTYWVTHDPDLTTEDTDSPRNFVLFFFVTAIVIYGVGMVQYAGNFVLSILKPNKITEFVDLCSICNISFLIFDESLHGYYIHGRSPYGQAEISQEKLRKALQFEGTGKAQMRGITAEDPDL
jgi:meckelin